MSIIAPTTVKALALTAMMAIGSYSASAQGLGLGNTEGDSGWLNPATTGGAPAVASRGNVNEYAGYQEGQTQQPHGSVAARGPGSNPAAGPQAATPSGSDTYFGYQEGAQAQPRGSRPVRVR